MNNQLPNKIERTDLSSEKLILSNPNTIITRDNLKDLQPSDLESEEIYRKLKIFISEINNYNESFEAKETFDVLWNLIDKNTRLVNNVDLLRRYTHLLIVLRVNFINLLGDKEIERFLREHTLLSLSVQLDSFPVLSLKEKLWLFIKFDTKYLDHQTKQVMLKSFTKALEGNEEFLGEDKLSIKGVSVRLPQMMKNWVLDYNKSYSVPVGGKRGNVERISYLNTNTNVRTLDEDQKKLLTKFFELYDWLRFADIDHEQFNYDDLIISPVPPVPTGPQEIKRTKILPLPPRPSREATAGAVRPQRREESTPSYSPPYHGGERGMGERPLSQPLPTPGERGAERKVFNRELYRQTLEELARGREEYEKKIQAPKTPTPLPNPPHQGEGNKAEMPEQSRAWSRISDIGAGARPNIPFIGYDQPFSVNEAIIRGDIEKIKQHGEIVKGSEDVDDKLKELKKKVDGNKMS